VGDFRRVLVEAAAEECSIADAAVIVHDAARLADLSAFHSKVEGLLNCDSHFPRHLHRGPSAAS
jgi:hypothetical protein